MIVCLLPQDKTTHLSAHTLEYKWGSYVPLYIQVLIYTLLNHVDCKYKLRVEQQSKGAFFVSVWIFSGNASEQQCALLFGVDTSVFAWISVSAMPTVQSRADCSMVCLFVVMDSISKCNTVWRSYFLFKH